MVGLSRWNATLLGTLFASLLQNALPRAQSARRGRNLSELSLFLENFNGQSKERMSRNLPGGKGMYGNGEGDEGNEDKEAEEEEEWKEEKNDYRRDDEWRKKNQDMKRRYEYDGSEDNLSNAHHYNEHLKRHSNDRRNCSIFPHSDAYSDENDSLSDDFVFKFSKNGQLPCGCTKRDISTYLTNDQIYFFVTHFFYLNRRETFIAYYYYITFLNRVYAQSMRNLKQWYTDLARFYGLPENLRRKYWEECRSAMIKDLRKIELMSKFYFFETLSTHSRIFIFRFNMLLRRCSLLWRDTKRYNKRKWTFILHNKLEIYRRAAYRRGGYVQRQLSWGQLAA
ncbi:hypothetical protein C922_02591 [Plasmodium inui San Antonio 1]|uniref:Plasmodium RESA N-terminal domain-containing protein n=1 Tax=Plasmodium inui San Antonio 1 TaxID=1237626 RepID=W7A1F0_9APIC|nr:hypothetical protein C922_02591 [Plasmodium inui San Antonio 1]EUD67007.1 hypothetical protein C922_02591 [Plasmodium inui San Antonio 1]